MLMLIHANKSRSSKILLHCDYGPQLSLHSMDSMNEMEGEKQWRKMWRTSRITNIHTQIYIYTQDGDGRRTCIKFSSKPLENGTWQFANIYRFASIWELRAIYYVCVGADLCAWLNVYLVLILLRFFSRFPFSCLNWCIRSRLWLRSTKKVVITKIVI